MFYAGVKVLCHRMIPPSVLTHCCFHRGSAPSLIQSEEKNVDSIQIKMVENYLFSCFPSEVLQPAVKTVQHFRQSSMKRSTPLLCRNFHALNTSTFKLLENPSTARYEDGWETWDLFSTKSRVLSPVQYTKKMQYTLTRDTDSRISFNLSQHIASSSYFNIKDKIEDVFPSVP